MNADELCFRPAEELARLIRKRELAPAELMDETLARIEAINPAINAFVQLDAELAMTTAREQTERLARGEDLGPLAGLPFGVKELENALGFRSTSASRVFAERWAECDDVHVARLKAAGAICIGKTNSPEFGYTAFTSNPLYGTTRNPWNLERTPGGSSGGAAAAITSGMVPLATASDGGGSVRIPAAFTGTFGLKPTFGLVPIAPRAPLPWIDTSCYGALTRTVRDAALYLDQVAGYHPLDPTSFPRPTQPFLAALDQPLPKLRIAFNRMLGSIHIQSDVLREVEQAAHVFQALGHEVEDNDDTLEDVVQHWITLSYAQSLPEVEQLVRYGRDLLSPAFADRFAALPRPGAEEIAAAYAARARLNQWLAQIFDRYDLLLLPTMPLEAFATEGPIPAEVEGIPLGDSIIACTAPFNFSGHPAGTVRAGFTDAGLPAGLQIVAQRHADALALRAAYAYEQARPWNDRWPSLSSA
jgi:aspartyl-tRNA(Asn)/glutamyl-tRNA(Gln) amidotransferase subunit A